MMAFRQSMAVVAVALMLVSALAPQIEAGSNGLVLSRPLTGTHAQYYDDASVSCLTTKEVDCSIDNPENGTISHELYRAKLGCCSGYDGHYIGASDNIVGRCEYTAAYWIPLARDADYPTLTGGFYGTCFLEKAAEACVEPCCEDMVLSMQGQIYNIEDVVTDDPSEQLLYKCFTDSAIPAPPGGGGDVAVPQRKGHHTGSKKTGVSKSTASTARYSGGQQLYHASDADVMTGPMTVFCSKSGQKWSGWLEALNYMNSTGLTPISHAEASGKTFLRPNDVLVKIYKDSEYEKST